MAEAAIPPKSTTDTAMTRKTFLQLGWAAFAAFIAGSFASSLRFFIPNVLYEPSQSFKAGKPDEYPLGVSTKWLKDQRIWIVRNEKGLYALWARCTHLGCTPSWFQAENRFRCPCHGSNFTTGGDVIAGPAPKPLYRCAMKLLPTGDLLVDKAILEDRPGLRDKSEYFVDYTA